MMNSTKCYDCSSFGFSLFQDIFNNIEDLNHLINKLSEENEKLNEIAQDATTSDVLTTLPIRLPQIIVDSLKSRFITAYLNGQLTKRRLERLVLRWDLTHKITIIREHLINWQTIKCKETSEVDLHINEIKVSYHFIYKLILY